MVRVRDERIFAMQEANARRSMLLLRQYEFMITRNEAYESILLTSRRNIIKAILNPAWLKRAVDIKQRELLAKHDKAISDAATMAAKPVIKPVVLAGNHG